MDSSSDLSGSTHLQNCLESARNIGRAVVLSDAQRILPNNKMQEAPSSLYYTASKAQKVAGVLAICGAICALGMTVAWASNDDTDKTYLGGLNWDKYVFNWHPVMMVAGMILCFICSLLSYRLINLPKFYTKILHALLHTCAITCILIGLTAAVTSHNYKDRNTGNKYTANLYTLHSLIGVSTMVLYFSTYIGGFLFFLTDLFNMDLKKWYKPNHIFMGLFALFSATAAVLTGINEKSTFLSCSYPVTSGDWNPAENYHLLPDGCKLANGIGIMVFASVFLCAYALLGPGATPNADDEISRKLLP